MTRISKLSRSISGRIAMITGAASGMGEATAYLFADEGARLALIDLNAEPLERVAEKIRSRGGEVQTSAFDVSDQAAVRAAVAGFAEHFGGLDILVNNAGISAQAPIDSPDYEAVWQRGLDVLISAQQRLIRAALPKLRESDAARIVNIASTEGLGATRYGSPYTAAKHAVIGLTRSLAVELGPEGITVNCICPGPIHTGMTQDIPMEAKQEYARRRTALRRYADPEEVAHGTLNFVLPASSFMTGVALPVDGGLTIRNA